MIFEKICHGGQDALRRDEGALRVPRAGDAQQRFFGAAGKIPLLRHPAGDEGIRLAVDEQNGVVCRAQRS